MGACRTSARSAGLALALASCQPSAHPESPEVVARSQAKAAASSAAAVAVAPGPLSLASASHPGESYAFALLPCTGAPPAATCPLELRLLRGAQLIAALPLATAWSDRVVSVSPDKIPGLGDPLGASNGWRAWTIGEGDAAQTFAARLVQLAPDREGVVLRTLRQGVAHDVVVLRRAEQLQTIDLEGQWTAISARSNQGFDELVRFAQNPGEPGSLWAQDLNWDAAHERFEPGSARDPHAFLVAVGSYASAADASAALGKSCLRGALVVASDLYEGLEGGKYFLGALSADANLAEGALRDAQRCADHPSGKVLPLRFRWLARGHARLGAGSAELGIGRYDGTGWPLVVSLPGAHASTSALAVSWPANAPVMEPATAVDLPAGDPLEPLRGPAGWSLGTGDGGELCAVQSVRLAPDRPALLVSMESGFEHRSRRHDLVVRDGIQLRVAWSAVDPPGPAGSTVVVHAKDETTDEVLFISTFAADDDASADRLEASRIRWDATKQDVVAAPVSCNDGVYLLNFGSFVSLKQASRVKGEPCAKAAPDPAEAPAFPLVLPAPPASKQRGYLLAQVSTDLALARKARCHKKAPATVLAWCSQ